jgi:hypothetical protein
MAKNGWLHNKANLKVPMSIKYLEIIFGRQPELNQNIKKRKNFKFDVRDDKGHTKYK